MKNEGFGVLNFGFYLLISVRFGGEKQDRLDCEAASNP